MPNHNRQHNDGNFISLGSLLGLPVKLSNGIAEQNNNQTYICRGTYWYPMPNSAQQVWYVGIQDDYYYKCYTSYDIYMKIK